MININYLTPVHNVSKAHAADAGADIVLLNPVTFAPFETLVVPLGFSIDLRPGYMASMYPRSSISAKGLLSSLAPVDSGYTGEVHAILTNSTPNVMSFSAGSRLVQMIITKVEPISNIVQYQNERGASGLGSTGS